MKKLLLIPLLMLFVSASLFSQTYKNRDNVPGRGRGISGTALQYRQFFKQNRIKGNMGTKNNPTLITLTSGQDESGALEAKIQEVSNAGGGYILASTSNPSIPVQLKNVRMESNVHLMFEASVKLEFPDDKAGSLFIMGDKKEIVNVAITCKRALGNTLNESDWFSANVASGLIPNTGGQNSSGLRQNRNFCKVNDVSNFKISGVKIQDDKTEINAINLSSRNELINPGGTLPNGDKDKRIVDSRDNGPSNGIISNITLTDGAGGYGLMQAQIAKDVLFFNLTTIGGGVTVRFESGSPSSNNVGFKFESGNIVPNIPVNKKTLDRVFSRKIRSEKGSIALLLNPHRVKQGVIDVDDVSAKESFTVVKIDAGFSDANGNANIEATKGPALDQVGDFDAASIVTNVVATSGDGVNDMALNNRRGSSYYTCTEFTNNILPNPRAGETAWNYKSLGGIEDNATPVGVAHGHCDASGTKPRGCFSINLPAPNDIILNGNNFGRGKSQFRLFSANLKQSRVRIDGNCKNGTANKSVNNEKESATNEISKTVYPNPTSGIVNLPVKTNWEVYSVTGVKVANGNGKIIDLSLYNKGLYLIKTDTTTHRIIKE